MNALIVIAHGSKKEKSNNEFIKLVKKIENKDKNYHFVKASFLELAEPSIEKCVEELLLKGTTSITFYPFFLNSGKHIQVDIPNIVNELCIKYQDINFKTLPHFGMSEKISEIILEDIK